MPSRPPKRKAKDAKARLSDGAPYNEIKHPKKRAFLIAYTETGHISNSAKAVGMSRWMHFHWMLKDPAYAAAFAQAKGMAATLLEEEARRRAVDGLIRKKFADGKPVIDPKTGEQYTEMEYSDTLLIFLLKGLAPETFREHTSIKHEGGVTITKVRKLLIIPAPSIAKLGDTPVR